MLFKYQRMGWGGMFNIDGFVKNKQIKFVYKIIGAGESKNNQ